MITHPTVLPANEREILLGRYREQVAKWKLLYRRWLMMLVGSVVFCGSGFLIATYRLHNSDAAGAAVALACLSVLFSLIGALAMQSNGRSDANKVSILSDARDIKVEYVHGTLTRKQLAAKGGGVWGYYIDNTLVPELNVPQLDNLVGQEVGISYIPALSKIRSITSDGEEETLIRPKA